MRVNTRYKPQGLHSMEYYFRDSMQVKILAHEV